MSRRYILRTSEVLKNYSSDGRIYIYDNSGVFYNYLLF